jgi:hypothetical protein
MLFPATCRQVFIVSKCFISALTSTQFQPYERAPRTLYKPNGVGKDILEKNKLRVDNHHYFAYARTLPGEKRSVPWTPELQQPSKSKLNYAGYKTRNHKPDACSRKSDRRRHGESISYVGGTRNEQYDKDESLDTQMQDLALDTSGGSGVEVDEKFGSIIQDPKPSSNDQPRFQLSQQVLERELRFNDWKFDYQPLLPHPSDDGKLFIEIDAGHGLRANHPCKQLGEAEPPPERMEQVGQTGPCESHAEQKPEVQLEQIPSHPTGVRFVCGVVDSRGQYEAQSSTGYRPIFPRFGELPTEIRTRIFEFARLSWGPNTVSMYCLPRTKTTEKTLYHSPSFDPPRPLSKDSKDIEPREVPDDWPWELRARYKISPLLHTNFEARKAAQKYYKLSFGYQLSTKHGVWFDFAQDRLIMDSGGAFELFKHGAEDTEQDRVQLSRVEKDLRFLILKDLTPSDVVGLCEYADGLQKLQNLYLLKNFEAQYKDLEDYFFYRVELELIKSWSQTLGACHIQQFPRVDVLDNRYFREILDLSDGEGTKIFLSPHMPYPTGSDLVRLRRKPRHRHLASLRRHNTEKANHLISSEAERGFAKFGLGYQAPAA